MENDMNIDNENSENTYFEVDGLGEDEDGNACPAFVSINIQFNTDAPEENICEFVAKLLRINKSRVTMISKEKYMLETGCEEMEE